ncbi:hypothetical protein ABT214_33705, partial [Micromonospora purpureochromogenes]|uniref:hypothetical protein n=1 Tax=Micromonospora purpureochromogenes TaxID=47872 RepID=UPI00332794D4
MYGLVLAGGVVVVPGCGAEVVGDALRPGPVVVPVDPAVGVAAADREPVALALGLGFPPWVL